MKKIGSHYDADHCIINSLFYLLGLKYYDPPISFGMEVNLVMLLRVWARHNPKNRLWPKTPNLALKK